MKNQQGAPEALPDPSPDQLRAIARTARNSSGSASDDCGPLDYVLHGWRAAVTALRTQQPAPADPMDWPLPCDVTVGHGTMRKGVSLRTLVTRMKVLYEMATGNSADEVANRTPEENTALADAFRARIGAAHQPSPTPQAAESAPATANSKLLPCPCCGGEAAEHDRFNSNTVRCLSCGLRVKQSEMGMGDAAARWNTRTARAQAESVTAPAGGVVAVPRETLRAWRQWCAQSMSHAIEHEISDFLAAAPTQPAQAADSVEHATRRWAAPKYDHQQREWCVAYEAETGFDPMMDDYEAGLKTFAEAAVASLRWYEDHTSDAHLRISRKAIPGGRYDAAHPGAGRGDAADAR